MNWKEIAEKYPKAFNKFFKWYWPDDRQSFDGNDLYFCQTVGDENYAECSISYESFCEIRKFYDFFDEQMIWIDINPDYEAGWEYHTKPRNNEEVYFWININWVWEDNIHYKTRQEAEEAAFTKAFGILENELKHKL